MQLISVIIPVFNMEDSLDDTIKSVVEQTYSNLDIVCVDDGSTDGSLEKLKI
jgi:glycosyltransferase involved in cell wall biosynthesis